MISKKISEAKEMVLGVEDYPYKNDITKAVYKLHDAMLLLIEVIESINNQIPISRKDTGGPYDLSKGKKCEQEHSRTVPYRTLRCRLQTHYGTFVHIIGNGIENLRCCKKKNLKHVNIVDKQKWFRTSNIRVQIN